MSDTNGGLKWYKIIFKQMSPIHIGMKNYGVLSETRVFIPGWTIWGALVNNYGKYTGGEVAGFEKGKRIFQNITCFYPEIDDKSMFPNFKNGRLYMGDVSEKQFRISNTDVLMSTAIDPAYISAKDASLHETEFILHKSKDTKKNTFWIGLLGIKEEDKSVFNDFMSTLDEIFIGGEISYGYGQLKKEKDLLIASGDDLKDWDLNDDGSLFIDSNDLKPIRSYIQRSDDIKPIKSRLEYIVQYDFSKNKPSIVSAGNYFIPGSEVDLKDKDNASFSLKKGCFSVI